MGVVCVVLGGPVRGPGIVRVFRMSCRDLRVVPGRRIVCAMPRRDLFARWCCFVRIVSQRDLFKLDRNEFVYHMQPRHVPLCVERECDTLRRLSGGSHVFT